MPAPGDPPARPSVNWAHLLPAVVLLGFFWVALPAPLPRPLAGPLNEQCLTVLDKPEGDRPSGAESGAVAPSILGVLEKCSALYPDDVELLADLGAAYESVGRAAPAESAYQHALAIDPAYADLRLRLGRLMLRRGAAEDARSQAEAGLQVQPNRLALRDLLAETRRPVRSIHQ